MYEGDDIVNLMRDEEGESPRQIINLAAWQKFFTDESIVCYIPLNNQLLIKRSANSAAAGGTEGDVYIYEFNTKSWVTGVNRMIKNKDCSNFITFQDGTVAAMTAHTGDDVPEGGIET